MKKPNIKHLIASALVFASTNSLASYKVAIIENIPGTDAIKSGNFAEGIKQITESKQGTKRIFKAEHNINLCVAYFNDFQLHNANKTCDAAIDDVKSISGYRYEKRQLLASALNNRGVYRVKLQDYNGALQDFKAAQSIKNLPLIEQNKQLLEKQIKQVQTVAKFDN